MQPHGQQQSNQDAPKALRVFIGSTSLDLTDYRRAAIAACNELGVVPIAMEFFGAADAGATAGSRGNVTRAQGYVGIYAHRYGYIEKGYDKSVTELEFDRAAELELERLCFVVDPKFPWPPDAWEYAHHDALERFKARIDTLIRGRFTTVDDFKAQLANGLLLAAILPSAAKSLRIGLLTTIAWLHCFRTFLSKPRSAFLAKPVWSNSG